MSLNLKNKVVFITGASSGIGKASAYQFAEKGARVIIAARRLDRINQIAEDIRTKHKTDTLPVQLNIQDKAEVKSVIENLPDDWRDIDILVNNAGLALDVFKFQEGNLESWDAMIDTNFRGLVYVTREILPSMIARDSGHIVNIGSIAGHEYYSSGNIYSATKHAVKAISKSLRIDLVGTSIRVTEIAPGAVHTEFSEVRFKDKNRADDFYKGFQPLTAEDVADTVLYCTTRPAHVDIAELQIYPVAQASANHISKEGAEVKGLFD